MKCRNYIKKNDKKLIKVDFQVCLFSFCCFDGIFIDYNVKKICVGKFRPLF